MTTMRRRKVLIIEDEADIRESLKEAIEDNGFEVFTASNGKEGLEAIPKIDDLGLILLDLTMPVMNGWEFLKQMEKSPQPERIPVVIVSAFSEQAKNLHTAGAIQKPIEINGLLDTVEYYCGHGFQDSEVIMDVNVGKQNAAPMHH